MTESARNRTIPRLDIAPSCLPGASHRDRGLHLYASVCIESRMRVGVAGASGYVGRRAPALPRGAPDLRRRRRDRRAPRRATRSRTHAPSLAAAYPALAYAPSTAEALDGCELVFVALPHGRSAPLVGALSAHGLDRRRPRGGPAPRATPRRGPTWYGEPHPAPELRGHRGLRPRRAPPRRARAARAPWRCRGATRRRRSSRSARCSTPALVGHGPVVGQRDERRVGRGRGARRRAALRARSPTTPAPTACSPPPHRRDGAGARRARCSSRRTSSRWTAGCSPPAPRRRPAGVDTAAALAALHDAYDHEPFVVVTDEPPRPKARAGHQRRARDRARRPAHRVAASRSCAIDNLGKGAAGQAIQCANVALRARRDRGPRARGGLAVSVVDPEGLRRGGRPRRASSRPARPDCAVVACTTPATASRGGGLHDEPGGRGPRRRLAGAPRRDGRARPGDRRHLGQRERRDRRGRARGGARRCARRSRTLAGATPDEVLVAQTGLIGVPVRLRRRRPRGAAPVRDDRLDAGARRGGGRRGDAHDRPGPEDLQRDVRRVPRRGDGEGRRDARPEHGDDAGRAHDGRGVRAGAALPSSSATRSPRRSTGSTSTASTSTNDTVRGPRLGRRGARLARAAGRRARTRRAPRSPRQMVDDAEGATRDRDGLGPRGGERPPGPPRRSRRRRLAPRQVLAQRRGPLLGARRRRARRGGHRLRARPRDRPLRRDRGLRRGRGRRATTPPRSPRTSRAATSSSSCDLGLGSGEGSVLCCDLGPGYLDENRTTS